MKHQQRSLIITKYDRKEEKMKTKILVVIDMQNDFISGSLGTEEAKLVVQKVVQKIKDHPGVIFVTKDTHDNNYLYTQEGFHLPVPHCIKGTKGWELEHTIEEALQNQSKYIIEKPSFGSLQILDIVDILLRDGNSIEEIELVGLCTDICVISNAMILKAKLPEVPLIVDASCCAGVTPESHKNALESMKMCQIQIINEISNER